MKAIGILAALFVVLLGVCTAIAHGAAGRTRTLHVKCLYAPSPNGVAEVPCTVTIPARVRLGRYSMLYVEAHR